MNEVEAYRLLQKWSGTMHGVFITHDLKNLFNEKNDVLLHRRINSLEKHGLINRFKQGVYTTEPFDPYVLVCRMCPGAYISMGNILADKLLIGSVPAKAVYAVKPGRTRTFKGQGLTIICLGIKTSLIFGTYRKGEVTFASPEKAFLDCLYFRQKGLSLSFDILSDVDTTRFDHKKISTWLAHYRNLRFVAFVKGVLTRGQE